MSLLINSLHQNCENSVLSQLLFFWLKSKQPDRIWKVNDSISLVLVQYFWYLTNSYQIDQILCILKKINTDFDFHDLNDTQ